mmetsp:Transcript_102343/g.325176  ORF Transcript_102343/g.325176 Transcript_102343/m.325176 type:complete len:553 (-) Transcript_102343:321-1979(-)
MELAAHGVHPWSETAQGLIALSADATDSDEPHGTVILPAPFPVRLRRWGRSWPCLVVGGTALLVLSCASVPATSWHGGAMPQLWARGPPSPTQVGRGVAPTGRAPDADAAASSPPPRARSEWAPDSNATNATSVPPPPEATDNDAYCWLVTQSSGEEADLVRAHYIQARSVFSCRGWSVFTDRDDLAPVSAVTNIGPVRAREGPWGSRSNTGVFLRAWSAVVAGGRYRGHPWTLKVDADSVFFPGRLGAHVGGLNPDDPWFLKDDGMLYAPIEVFSRAAVGLYAANGRQKCTDAGVTALEEDSFFDYCMHTLGVTPKADEHLLMSCGDPDRCRERPFLAFHPFKTPALYDDCVSAARGSEEEEQQGKGKGLTGFCCLWGTDCYSCTGSNRPNRSTFCGKNPQRCQSCGTRATWCQPPREPVQCGARRVITLYHQTSPHICDLILQSNFRVGKVGWCGGGIYFAASAYATTRKAIGHESHHGFLIEARIDLGRVKHMGSSCFSRRLGVSTLSRTPTSHYLHQVHADSFVFNPVDGTEYVIANPRRVISMRQVR